MSVEVTMPQLSDTMTEGTVVKWHKKEGDKIKSGEELADVETDKAVMPMEAFDGGTLAVIKVKEGGKIPVGGVLAVIAAAGENIEDVKKKYAGGSAEPAKAPTKPAPEVVPPPAAAPIKPVSTPHAIAVHIHRPAQARALLTCLTNNPWPPKRLAISVAP